MDTINMSDVYAKTEWFIFDHFWDFGANDYDDESQNPEIQSDVETLKIGFFCLHYESNSKFPCNLKLAKSTWECKFSLSVARWRNFSKFSSLFLTQSSRNNRIKFRDISSSAVLKLDHINRATLSERRWSDCCTEDERRRKNLCKTWKINSLLFCFFSLCKEFTWMRRNGKQLKGKKQKKQKVCVWDFSWEMNKHTSYMHMKSW